MKMMRHSQLTNGAGLRATVTVDGVWQVGSYMNMSPVLRIQGRVERQDGTPPYVAVFDEVVAACSDPRRPQGWITGDIAAAYGELHRLGWAHSVEAWRDGELAGGLYGVGIGGLFAGESMYHRVRDASKVALVALVDLLRGGGATLLDVQWTTPHLASLGAIDVPRTEYLARLSDALARADG